MSGIESGAGGAGQCSFRRREHATPPPALEDVLPELPVSGLFLAPMTAETAVARFRGWLEGRPILASALPLQLNASGRRTTREALAARRAALLAALDELRGRNLACWCAEGAPCHADVLLDLANR